MIAMTMINWDEDLLRKKNRLFTSKLKKNNAET